MTPVRRLLVAAGVLLLAGPAAAQFPLVDPWHRGTDPFGYDPVFNPFGRIYLPPPVRPPVVGFLPNGTPVINPWIRGRYVNPVDIYTANVVASQIAAARWQAAQALYWSQPVYGSGFGGPVPPPVFPPVLANRVQIEPGRFVPAGPGLAVNPVSGTVLAPFRGVALTNEGPFYRAGGVTAFGTYVPSAGVYVNPITGARYNPATGVIVR